MKINRDITGPKLSSDNQRSLGITRRQRATYPDNEMEDADDGDW